MRSESCIQVLSGGRTVKTTLLEEKEAISPEPTLLWFDEPQIGFQTTQEWSSA